MGPQISRSNSGGFTLVEVMMAMLIMSVGLFGLLQSVSVAYEHNARNRLREEAVQVAEEQMNEMRGRLFDNISVNRVQTLTRSIAGGFRNFSVNWQAQTMPLGGNTKKLTVTVGWTFKRLKFVHEIYTMKNR